MELKKVENMGVRRLVEELRKLNLTGKFEVIDDFAIQISGIGANELVLPEGYECNEKNGITNKHHIVSGMYEMFSIEMEED